MKKILVGILAVIVLVFACFQMFIKDEDVNSAGKMQKFTFETAYGTVEIEAEKALTASGYAGATNTIYYIKDGKLYKKNSEDEATLIAEGVKDINDVGEGNGIELVKGENFKMIEEDSYLGLSAEWRNAYEELLEEKYDPKFIEEEYGYIEYSIVDIDEDGMPEILIYKYTCEADKMAKVYTYKNGEIVELGDLGAGHTVYYIMNDGAYLLHLNGHMGYETLSKIYIENGELFDEYISDRELAQDEDYTRGDEEVKIADINDFSLVEQY